MKKLADLFANALLFEPKLIHWAQAKEGQCKRKDSQIDVDVVTVGETTTTHTAVASHIGNVTCPTCRQLHRGWKPRGR